MLQVAMAGWLCCPAHWLDNDSPSLLQLCMFECFHNFHCQYGVRNRLGKTSIWPLGAHVMRMLFASAESCDLLFISIELQRSSKLHSSWENAWIVSCLLGASWAFRDIGCGGRQSPYHRWWGPLGDPADWGDLPPKRAHLWHMTDWAAHSHEPQCIFLH